MDAADAILWGATGGPETKEVPPAARKAGSLLSMRSKYDLYANLRPIRANPVLAESAPLKARVLRDVNFVIIRELTSGIYFGEPRGIETHLQTIAESDEGITRQPLSSLDAFQQESRAKGRQLQIGRYRRIEIGCDVKRRLHSFNLQISRATKNPPPTLRRRWVLDTDKLN